MQKKSQFEKLDLKTKDLTQENIAKILSLFPNLINEVEKVIDEQGLNEFCDARQISRVPIVNIINVKNYFCTI